MKYNKMLDHEVYKGPHCMECGSKRKERLKTAIVLNREVVYCRDSCLTAITKALKNEVIKV